MIQIRGTDIYFEDKGNDYEAYQCTPSCTDIFFFDPDVMTDEQARSALLEFSLKCYQERIANLTKEMLIINRLLNES
jgi:hypothetical protein